MISQLAARQVQPHATHTHKKALKPLLCPLLLWTASYRCMIFQLAARQVQPHAKHNNSIETPPVSPPPVDCKLPLHDFANLLLDKCSHMPHTHTHTRTHTHTKSIKSCPVSPPPIDCKLPLHDFPTIQVRSHATRVNRPTM